MTAEFHTCLPPRIPPLPLGAAERPAPQPWVVSIPSCGTDAPINPVPLDAAPKDEGTAETGGDTAAVGPSKGSGSAMLSFDIRHTSQAAAEAALAAASPAAGAEVAEASAEQAAVPAGDAEAASGDTSSATVSVTPGPAASSMTEVGVGGRAAGALAASSPAQHLGESRFAAPSHISEVPAAPDDAGLSQGTGHLVGAALPVALPTGPAATSSAAERAGAVAGEASAKASGNDLGLSPEDYEAVTFDF